MVKRYLTILFLFALTLAVDAQVEKTQSLLASVPRWSVSAYGGYSNMLFDVPVDLGEEFANYMKRLKSGYHIGFDGMYFFSHFLGTGIALTTFYSSESKDSLTATNGFFTIKSNISDKMRIYSIAPLLVGRFPFLKNRLQVIAGTGPAYLNYRNDGKALTDSATFTGSSAGILGRLTFDYSIFPKIFLGVGAGYTYSVLKKISKITVAGKEIMILNKDEYQNISRFDVSFSLRYRFR